MRSSRDCVESLAGDEAHAELRNTLKAELFEKLKEQGDPRMLGRGEVFDRYGFASERWNNFYEKYQRGEKISTGWVLPSDYEKEEIE